MRACARDVRSFATAVTILALFVLPIQSPQVNAAQPSQMTLLDVLLNAVAWCHFLDGDKDNDILAGCAAAYQPAVNDVGVSAAPERPRVARRTWEMASDVEGTRVEHAQISSHVRPRSPSL